MKNFFNLVHKWYIGWFGLEGLSYLECGTPEWIRTTDLLLRREKLHMYVLHSTGGPARL